MRSAGWCAGAPSTLVLHGSPPARAHDTETMCWLAWCTTLRKPLGKSLLVGRTWRQQMEGLRMQVQPGSTRQSALQPSPLLRRPSIASHTLWSCLPAREADLTGAPSV